MEKLDFSFEPYFEQLATQLASSIFQTTTMLSELVRITEKQYNGSHSQFVGEKAEQVARHLGCSEGECFEIKTAGFLHDIGKISFPDHIMEKLPTELGAEDYRYYTSHLDEGYRILSMHEGLKSIADIIRQHHERLDGSGFPYRLKGNDICLGARIISVVNYYHNAMYRLRDKTPGISGQITSTATYLRSTQPRFAQTMNYLYQKVGIFYSSNIVDAFTSIIEAERRQLGERTIMRMSVNQVKPGMMFASDYSTSYGLLIAALGEPITSQGISRLISLAEIGEIPQKILVMK
jgi:putative nucleotidyltransferase with HDIG domain